VSVVLRAMLGEEEVNNSAAFLSRFWLLFQLVKFSVGCCNCSCPYPFTRENFIDFMTATPAWGLDGMVIQPSGLLVLFMKHAVTHTVPCCKSLLCTLQCYQMCSRTNLACFVLETNPHFIGSVPIFLRAYMLENS